MKESNYNTHITPNVNISQISVYFNSYGIGNILIRTLQYVPQRVLPSVLMLTIYNSMLIPQVFEGRECQPVIVGPTLPGNPTPLWFCRKEVALE